MEKEVFNADEAAEFLQTEKRTILNLIHDNKITAKKIGKGYKMHKTELVKYLKGETGNSITTNIDSGPRMTKDE